MEKKVFESQPPENVLDRSGPQHNITTRIFEIPRCLEAGGCSANSFGRPFFSATAHHLREACFKNGVSHFSLKI